MKRVMIDLDDGSRLFAISAKISRGVVRAEGLLERYCASGYNFEHQRMLPVVTWRHGFAFIILPMGQVKSVSPMGEQFLAELKANLPEVFE